MIKNPPLSNSDCRKSNQPQIETILLIVLKFPDDRHLFLGRRKEYKFGGKVE